MNGVLCYSLKGRAVNQMAKPYAQEEDILVFLEPSGKRKYLYVYNIEDVVLDNRTSFTSTNAVATNTLTTAKQEQNLEPNKTTEPEHEIYQVRVGVNGGCKVYVELNAGEARRGTWKQPRPNSTTYYVGYLDAMSSPYEDPRFEMWLRYNQYPAFLAYNPWEVRKVETRLSYIGKKLKCFDMEHEETPGLIDSDPKSNIAAILKGMLNAVKAGQYPHRAITPRGIMR